MHLYNTLSRQKDAFKPKDPNNVRVYACGPTPYNFAHIGNLRTYLFEDMVIRSLKFLGYKLHTVMNVTDIDDKTIRDSQKNGETLLDLTQKYTRFFLEDLEHLHVLPPDELIPISAVIDEMVLIINGLLQKGFAYVSDDGSVYYSIAKFKKYGELAKLDRSGMKESVRINNDEYDKENVADFALWKAYSQEDGPNVWNAEFTIGDEKKIIP